MLDNQKLVVHIAKQFSPPNHTEMMEYIQCGMIGLMLAIRKWKPEYGKLSTYAWKPIRWEILRYIKKQTRPKHLSISEDIEEVPRAELSEYIPDGLSESELTTLCLRQQGYSFKAIGNVSGCSKTVARNQFNRTIEKIRRVNT